MKVAVVGSGVTGLSAAWLLGQKHEVSLFEVNNRIGGHSNTVVVKSGGRPCPIDTGFIVYNVASYPNLIALFEHLDVPTTPTDMSFSVSMEQGRYEYNGNGLLGLFGQPQNLLSLQHLRMTRDILRFFRETSALDVNQIDPDVSLGRWLEQNGYSKAFVRRHILPMGAAIWSTPAQDMLDFPFAAFVRFFANHGLLQVAHRPQWRTVVGGSREYVRRILQAFDGTVRTDEGAAQVVRHANGVDITTTKGNQETYDACVLACHGDEALNVLASPTDDEQNLLSKFRYAQNRAVLHRDASQMPKRRHLWTSWNYLSEGDDDAQRLAVTYWMNLLQPLETSTDYFVTLNPITPIAPETIVTEIDYSHPLYDAAAMQAQKDLWCLQGKNRTWFAGSYFGYGFHEDGLQAGLAVAEDLGGVTRPWQVHNPRGRILADHANNRVAAPREQDNDIVSPVAARSSFNHRPLEKVEGVS